MIQCTTVQELIKTNFETRSSVEFPFEKYLIRIIFSAILEIKQFCFFLKTTDTPIRFSCMIDFTDQNILEVSQIIDSSTDKVEDTIEAMNQWCMTNNIRIITI